MAPSEMYLSIAAILIYWALQGQSRSIILRRKHKILKVPFNSALKTTQKSQVFKLRDKNIELLSFIPHCVNAKPSSKMSKKLLMPLTKFPVSLCVLDRPESCNFPTKQNGLFTSYKKKIQIRLLFEFCKEFYQNGRKKQKQFCNE